MTQKFKTNIKCSGCIATITPVLNKTVGQDNWEVDIQDPNKILSVAGDTSDKEIIAALKQAGYQAEKI